MGGTSLAPIQKFHTRYFYSSHIPFAKQESEVSKILLNQWTTCANDFKKVTKHMSYAQVLSKNLVSPNNTVHQDFRYKHKQYFHTLNMNMSKSGNENKVTSIHGGVIKNHSKPQCNANNSAVVVTDMACAKASGGSVTKMNTQPHKVTDVNTLPLKNRFKPLQYSPVTELTEELSNYHNDTHLTSAVSSSNATALKLKFKNPQSSGHQFRSLSDSSSKPAAQAKSITLEGNKK